MTTPAEKCNRDWHDAFGKPYEECTQCFIRDNGPWENNPWITTTNEVAASVEKLKNEIKRKKI